MSSPAYLLDSNVLIALLTEGHVFRQRVIEWLDASPKIFAVCSITQGAFLRVYLRVQPGASFAEGQRALRELSELDDYRFVPDDQNYLSVSPHGIRGHRQVTEAYLANLAVKHDMKLATFDQGLVALHPAAAVQLP